MPAVELVGGPNDGVTIQVPDDELLGRLEFEEPRTDPSGPMRALLAGERVLAADIEAASVVRHVYSRTEARNDAGAIIYRYVS